MLATTALGSPAENEVRERVISGRLYQVLIGTNHGRADRLLTGPGVSLDVSGLYLANFGLPITAVTDS